MLSDEIRLGTIVCTTALEVRLLAALVAERRQNSRQRKPPPKDKPKFKPAELHPAPCEPAEPVGPPEPYGPPRPSGAGWRPASEATILDVQMAVAREWNVTLLDLKSDRRTKDIVGPRHVAVMLCTVLIGCSLPKLGRQFGGRDHTTMLHSKEKYDWMRCELINRLSAGDPLNTWARTARELWLANTTNDNPAFVSSTQRAKAFAYWQKRKQQEAADEQTTETIPDCTVPI
jgi:DnaA-like protein